MLIINPKSIPIVVRSEEDIVHLSRTFVKENLTPIFFLSNVSG